MREIVDFEPAKIAATHQTYGYNMLQFYAQQ